jgi:L-serine/L-threonine ammonia-lyase
MQRAIASHGSSKPIRFYCSSGGNAGLACVTAAMSLNRPATIVVPNSTSEMMVAKLENLGANVHQVGANWAEADAFLRKELLAKDENGVYVPPFDHLDIWDGHSTIIEELDRQIGDYDAVVCSVGGGGLFCGIMEGLQSRKFSNGKIVKVLAVETIGADSLIRSILENDHITLPGITSIAGSLGCTKVAKRAFELAQNKNVFCLALSDAEAAMGSVRFADDERFLVEVSCGVSVATVYGGQLRMILGKEMSDEEWSRQRIVIEICGGSGVSLDILESYREKYGSN